MSVQFYRVLHDREFKVSFGTSFPRQNSYSEEIAVYLIIGSSRIRWWFEITVTANWKATGGSMKPFVAFPVVPFINHLSPLATNIETILRSCGITLLAVYMHTLIWVVSSLSTTNSSSSTSSLAGIPPLPGKRRRTKPSFYCADLDEEFLLRSGRAPRNLIITRAGIELRWRKVRKEVLRLALVFPKKGKIEGDKVHLGRSPSFLSLSLSVVLSLAPRRDGRALPWFSCTEGKGKLNFPRIIKNRVLLRDAEWTEMKFASRWCGDAASLAAFFRRNYSTPNSKEGGFNSRQGLEESWSFRVENALSRAIESSSGLTFRMDRDWRRRGKYSDIFDSLYFHIQVSWFLFMYTINIWVICKILEVTF